MSSPFSSSLKPPSSPQQQQHQNGENQLSLPMERRDTGASRASAKSTSSSSRRVNFLTQPSREVKRYGSRMFTRKRIVQQVFALFVLLALILSIWYLVSSIIFKPVKEILLEELGANETDVDELIVSGGRSRGNMTDVFSHAISDLLAGDDDNNDNNRTSTSSSKNGF